MIVLAVKMIFLKLVTKMEIYRKWKIFSHDSFINYHFLQSSVTELFFFKRQNLCSNTLNVVRTSKKQSKVITILISTKNSQ